MHQHSEWTVQKISGVKSRGASPLSPCLFRCPMLQSLGSVHHCIKLSAHEIVVVNTTPQMPREYGAKHVKNGYR